MHSVIPLLLFEVQAWVLTPRPPSRNMACFETTGTNEQSTHALVTQECRNVSVAQAADHVTTWDIVGVNNDHAASCAAAIF